MQPSIAPSPQVKPLESAPGPFGKVQYLVQGQKFEVTKAYTLNKVVGSGAYGIVCAALDQRSLPPQKVAIKKISKVFDELIDCKRILRELKVLSFVRHTNLLRLREFIRPNDKLTFNEVYVVTDLYDSDLGRIIKSQQSLSEEHLQYFLCQSFRGLHHLHTANVIHRDLKPSNILVNANCEIAICDFGLARGESSGDLTQYVVTRWYRPPELLSLTSHYTTSVDMWSMGLIFSELLCGRTLLPGKDYVAQLAMVVDLLGTPSDEDVECLSESARRFVKNQPKKPHRDLSTLFPKASPEAVDLLTKLLQFHPSRRPTTAECIAHPFLAKFRDAAEEQDASEKFAFDLDNRESSAVELRELLWDEIVAHSDELEEQQTAAEHSAS